MKGQALNHHQHLSFNSTTTGIQIIVVITERLIFGETKLPCDP